VSVPQQPFAKAQPTDLGLISESETIMPETFPIHGGKNHKEREPVAADQMMADQMMADPETTVVDYFPLTEECHHYTRRSDVDWDIQK
jgi:hypothetical protein